MLRTFAFLAILLIAVVLTVDAASSLSYDKVHLVDEIVKPEFTNYIFRGNVPLVNGAFAYDTLSQYMTQRAKESDITLPHNFYLVDVTLMNPFDEPQAEKDFWKKADPSVGEYVVWAMGLAGLYDARSYDERTQMEMSNSTVWAYDMMPERISALIHMAHQPGPIDPISRKPRTVIFYLHCMAGADRTGQMVIGYRLGATPLSKFTPNTLQEYFALNVQAAGRSPNDWSVKATEWLCLYFKYYFDVNMGDCLNIATCQRFKDCTWPPLP